MKLAIVAGNGKNVPGQRNASQANGQIRHAEAIANPESLGTFCVSFNDMINPCYSVPISMYIGDA